MNLKRNRGIFLNIIAISDKSFGAYTILRFLMTALTAICATVVTSVLKGGSESPFENFVLTNPGLKIVRNTFFDLALS